MRTIKIYKYKRADGGVTVTPNKPNCKCDEMVRLVADEGKGFYIGTDDEGKAIYAPCLDVENAEGYEEVEIPVEEAEPAEGVEETLADE